MAMKDCHNALAAVAAAMKIGDEKHGLNAWDHNTKSVEENRQDMINGMGRHLRRYANGERIDESGEPTLAHVIARGLLALEFEERKKRGPCTDTCGVGEHGEDPRCCDRYLGHREMDGTLHRHGNLEWL